MGEGDPDSAALDAPVILLGRGGSGTRMLSEHARAQGVFLGTTINVSGDSVEWVDVLYELALEAMDAEITAGSARDRYWRDRLRRRAAEILATAGRPAALPWGWKLPETMLVLAPVLRAFPGARVIHLVRDPVTSALRRTHVTSRTDNPIGRAVLTAAYRSCGMDPGDIALDEPYLHNAISWAFQVRTVLDVLKAAGTPVLQLHYEHLCADPYDAQLGIAGFLGLPARAQAPPADLTRMNAEASSDGRAARVWSICGDVAVSLGYSAPAAALKAQA